MTVSPGSGSLAGQVALVTGGARGIGLAVVAAFLEAGAAVGFCDIDAEVGGAAAAQLGGEAAFWPADVASEPEVAAFVAAATERFGPPTVLVNNAGVNANFDALAMTEAEWDRFFGVDLKAAWLGAKHALPHMLAAG